MAGVGPLAGSSATAIGGLSKILAKGQLFSDRGYASELRCDVVDAPLDACCGVLAQLAPAGVGICPIAQIGDRMLFLAAEGDGSPARPAAGLPAGVLVRRGADGLTTGMQVIQGLGCWVIPPDYATPSLPSVDAVLAVLAAAYVERQAALTARTIE